MIQLGIFAKTFQRDDVNSVCEAVKTHGFETIQFNMACAGLPPMPKNIPQKAILEVNQAIQKNGLKICGLSGTFNMCHPNLEIRREGFSRLETLAKHCKAIGSNLITLCTGTRDPHDKWKFHPENNSLEIWKDLLISMEKALLIAEEYDIQLGIEPELANVVNSAPKAHQLLMEMGNNRLKIVLDPANLFEQASIKEIKAQIDEAIDLLGANIIMTHAKDKDKNGHFVPPGKGIIPFDYFIKQLRLAGIDKPLIAHGFLEEEVEVVQASMEAALNAI